MRNWYDLVEESDLKKQIHFAKEENNSPTVVKVFENKFFQVAETSYDFVLVGLVSWTL